MSATRHLVSLLLAVLVATGGEAIASPGATETWKVVAAKLSIPVFKPTDTGTLRLDWVHQIVADPGCLNDGREQLRGLYSNPRGDYMEVLEGHPRYCNDRPVGTTPIRTLKVHGKRASLYDLGQPRSYVIEWCEKGTTIALRAIGLKANRLIEIARSMRPVDSAPARACLLE